MIAYCHAQWFQEMKYLKNEKQTKLAIDKKVIMFGIFGIHMCNTKEITYSQVFLYVYLNSRLYA